MVAFAHKYAKLGQEERPEEPPEDGDMTLPSRHRIGNSGPGGLRRTHYLSVTEAPHNEY